MDWSDLDFFYTDLDSDEHSHSDQNTVGNRIAAIFAFDVQPRIDSFDSLETVEVKSGRVVPIGERVVHGSNERHERVCSRIVNGDLLRFNLSIHHKNFSSTESASARGKKVGCTLLPATSEGNTYTADQVAGRIDGESVS